MTTTQARVIVGVAGSEQALATVRTAVREASHPRLKTIYEWRRPPAVGTVPLMECAGYPMMRRMLRGIRHRAEAEPATPGGWWANQAAAGSGR